MQTAIVRAHIHDEVSNKLTMESFPPVARYLSELRRTIRERRLNVTHLPRGSKTGATHPPTWAGIECKLFKLGYSTTRTYESVWWLNTSASPAKLNIAADAVGGDLYMTRFVGKMGRVANAYGLTFVSICSCHISFAESPSLPYVSRPSGRMEEQYMMDLPLG